MQNINKAYDLARERYGEIGVDTEAVLAALDRVVLSLHCWQGDDVGGFEHSTDSLTGGIQATGNYPGKARTPDELRMDIDKVLTLTPGEMKANVHAIYLETGGKAVDRNEILPEHFDNWADWARGRGIGLDFNPTFFSHPKSGDLSASSPDKSVREFWIEHLARSRKISEYFGKKTGKLSVNNIWFHDGLKDNPADRSTPRRRLMESLDAGRRETIDPKFSKDAVESKLFGIGSEAYVVGSHEFYMGYVMKNPGLLLTLDVGHFHPTESVAAKISALLLFMDELLLHVSRPVRWDSDHVVIMDDETLMIMQEVVRGGYEKRVHIALDYFDASINRIAAWTIGARNTRKTLLRAMLEPAAQLKSLQESGDFTAVLALTEEYKSMPWAAVWDKYCAVKNVPIGQAWLDEVRAYEKNVLSKR